MVMSGKNKSPSSNRGGKRPGAGRKPTIKDPVQKKITFSRADIESVERLGYAFGDYVRVATEEKLKRDLRAVTKK